MNVAVAGGTGFLGQHVVKALQAAGHTVTVVARRQAQGDGVRSVQADVGAQPLPAGALKGCDALINLVGIAVPRGDNTFERAHVDAVGHLVDAAKDVGIDRFVHISVVTTPGVQTPYHRTKAAGEAIVERSGLDYTILRPGLVYGPGDDMLSRLVELVRIAAVFAVPGGAPADLQVIDARDVADGIVRALEATPRARRTYDLVGPERLSLPGLVGRVSSALELRTRCIALPRALMRGAATAMEAVLPRPLIARAQVEMLIAGLCGDGGPAREDLGLTPAALSATRIREVADGVRPRLPSARLITSADHRAFVVRYRGGVWLPVAATAALLALPTVIPDVWSRMAVINGVLATAAVALLALPWRELLRPTLARVGIGLAAAAVMLGGGLATVAVLAAMAPQFAAGSAEVLAWPAKLSWPTAVAALVVIASAEDIVWRAGIALPLAARFGPVAASLCTGALFGVGHATSGPPILILAAFIAGSVWAALTIRQRSLIPTIVCHITWDLGMLALLPSVL